MFNFGMQFIVRARVGYRIIFVDGRVAAIYPSSWYGGADTFWVASY